MVDTLRKAAVVLGDEYKQDDKEEDADECDHQEASHVRKDRYTLGLELGLELMRI
jgi:hypothetical protein